MSWPGITPVLVRAFRALTGVGAEAVGGDAGDLHAFGIHDVDQLFDRLFREALAVAQSEANSVREKARGQVDAEKAKAFSGIDAQADKLSSLIVDRLLAA